MKTVVRLFFVLVLVLAALPASVVSAASEDYLDPTCVQVAQSLGASYKIGMIDGSIYCILYPPNRKWNRDMVIFAHGYVDARHPIGNAWDQIIRGDVNLPGILLGLGYGFATTSYNKNGLAVLQGVDAVVDLANFIHSSNKKVNRIYLTGASEGGLVTALAAEQYPDSFAGAFSTCGPIGDFQGQIDYWGNFRVGFDVAFPYALLNPMVLLDPSDPTSLVPAPYPASTPVYIDPYVIENWELGVQPYVVNWLTLMPANAVGLLETLGVPYDPANPMTVGESILGLLYYNVEATNDGRRTLVNNPLLTDMELATSFIGNPYGGNAYVTFPTDPDALAEIAYHYQTTGNAQIPLVIMHTSGDPIVPVQHATTYLQKALQQGTLLTRVLYLPVERYGHCSFTPAEMVLGFYTMVLRATLIPFSDEQIRAALPDARWQQEFKSLQEAQPLQQ